MRCLWLLLLAMLGACASPAPRSAPPPSALLNDALFASPSVSIKAEDVFALTPAMRRYVREDIAAQVKQKGPQVGLFDALYRQSQLKVTYDSTLTRNAAQAFDARRGNCLSLVIMTAALAKEMGLQVYFQSVLLQESWTRDQDTMFASGHVNVLLGAPLQTRSHQQLLLREPPFTMMIDFFLPEDAAKLHREPITEQTILAMFMNNRAAEALARGELNDAYWWAKEAIVQEPAFLQAYNTLGVIYRRAAHPGASEAAFKHVLALEPHNTTALSNMAALLQGQNRVAEAQDLSKLLASIQPFPPYFYFDQGQAALKAGNFAAAKSLFTQEVRRADYNPHFQYALAVAHFELGELNLATAHMAKAVARSTNGQQHALYAGKLAALEAQSKH